MKKFVPFFLAFLLLVLPSCTSPLPRDAEEKNSSENLSTTDSVEETSATKPCDHNLSESTYKEPDYGIDGIKYITCDKCDYSKLDKIPALPDAFELTVLDKYNVDDGTQRYVFFDIEIKNISQMHIREISGTLNVMKSKWLMLKCTFSDLNLAPGETTIIRGYNFTLDESDIGYAVQESIYNTPYEEITFSFETTGIDIAE